MTFNKPDIVATIERDGNVLKRRSRDFWTCCPFHADRTPSLKISPEKQVFYCFGCGQGGDVIDYVMKSRDCSFLVALEILGMKPGITPKVDCEQERRLQHVRAFRAWERQRLTELSHEIRQCRQIIDYMGPAALYLAAGIIDEMAEAEIELSILLYGTEEERRKIYEEATHG